LRQVNDASQKRALIFVLLFPEPEAAYLADQDLLALGAWNLHVGLIEADVGLGAACMEWLAAGFTDQKLFAEAALHDSA
jgi:hypothetical protein